MMPVVLKHFQKYRQIFRETSEEIRCALDAGKYSILYTDDNFSAAIAGCGC